MKGRRIPHPGKRDTTSECSPRDRKATGSPDADMRLQGWKFVGVLALIFERPLDGPALTVPRSITILPFAMITPVVSRDRRSQILGAMGHHFHVYGGT